METENLGFGDVLKPLEAGMRAYREGWNGKGMFIYRVDGATIEKQMLRGAAKEALKDVLAPAVEICSHIDMKAADGSISIGWAPSQADMIANDWSVM